jgi:pimeloyl-ACP methyl ester carboxylesterase
LTERLEESDALLGRIVECRTQDGLKLDGFLQCVVDHPRRPAVADGSFQAAGATLWIVVHGVASNFYSSRLLRCCAEYFVGVGCDAVRVNTRGHDAMAFFSNGLSVIQAGAAYESIGDSVKDLHAWVRWGRELGYQRIGILGHSLGAVKTVFSLSQSMELFSQVRELVLLSPPRFSPSLFRADPRGTRYASAMAQAIEAMEGGEPDKLMRVSYPFPMLISARAYREKYGEPAKYDYLPLASSIAIPTLWCFGSQEVRSGKGSFRDADQHWRNLGLPPIHSLEVIERGDHNYSEVLPELLQCIDRWRAGSGSYDSLAD